MSAQRFNPATLFKERHNTVSAVRHMKQDRGFPMAKRVFLDIETLPPDKSDLLIRDKIQHCTEEEYRKLALDPEYAKIICIGIIVEHDNQIVHHGTLGRDRVSGLFHLDEARMLRAFWNIIKGFDPYSDLLIGWNILDFDLHCIMMRSVIHQVKPSIDLRFQRFRDRPIYDVMWEFEHWRRKISLDEAAKVLGLKTSKTNDVNGSRVYDLFIEGRHQEICDYCLKDTELTRAIYYRVNFKEIESA